MISIQGRIASCYHSVSHISYNICLIKLRTIGIANLKTDASDRSKSHSDVTVAPVVPTAVSAHHSQNELHQDIPYALHRPAFL